MHTVDVVAETDAFEHAVRTTPYINPGNAYSWTRHVDHTPTAAQRQILRDVASLGIKFSVSPIGMPPGYTPRQDDIRLVLPRHYPTMDAFIGDMFHEIAHWSGAKPGRAPRVYMAPFMQMAPPVIFNQAYAIEDITAETTAALLCMRYGMGVPADSVPYVQSYWIRTLMGDDWALSEGMREARRAYTWLDARLGVAAVAAVPAPSPWRVASDKARGLLGIG